MRGESRLRYSHYYRTALVIEQRYTWWCNTTRLHQRKSKRSAYQCGVQAQQRESLVGQL